MKRLISIILVAGFAVACLLFAPVKCLATTWYVDTSGSDGNLGTKASPFASLYKAVSMVDPGDTVDIDGGTYMLAKTSTSPVIIARGGMDSAPITIQSTPGQSAILNASGVQGRPGDGVDIEADHIIFQNLAVEYGSANCLTVRGGSYCTIRNCTFAYGEWGGVSIGEQSRVRHMTHDAILNCDIHDNSQVNLNAGGYNWGGGTGMGNCSNCTISGNTVYHNWGEGVTDGAWDGSADSHNFIENNTIGDNFSVELYLNCSQYCCVRNNFVYADSKALLRDGLPATGIQIDNEANTYLGMNCRIFNNIVVGGRMCFTSQNSKTYRGFYDGGLNGFSIVNNVFYGGESQTVGIDNDSGNHFIYENNIAWQPKHGTTLAGDAGGGTRVLKTNCWDGDGANNMAMAGDVVLRNTNPGFSDPVTFTPNGYVLRHGSPCYAAGTNEYSLLAYDFNYKARPVSGKWTMGAFSAGASKGSRSETHATGKHA